MPLPAGVEKVTVTAGEPLTTFDGALAKGRLYFTGPDLATIGEDDLVLGGTAEAVLEDGEFTKVLVATDASGMSPTGWAYRVEAALTNGPGWVRYISLPKAVPAVKLSDILVPDPVAGEFTVLVDGSAFLAKDANLADVEDPATARANLGLGTAAVQNSGAFDAAGAATAAVSGHSVAVDPHGDRAYTDTQVAARVPSTRQVVAGTGLTGGGTLAADRTLAVSYGTTAGTAAAGDDARLADARTPTGTAGGALSGTYPNPSLSPAAIAAFDPAGSASTAQATATSTAAADATAKVAAHAVATDPHSDRSYADGKFATQLNLTALNGTVNTLSTTVTAIDGYLNDALTRVAAIEQGTAFLAGGHYTEPVELVDSAQPGSNPAAGVYVFSEGGVLKTLSPSGEVVSLLPSVGWQERTARVRITDDDLSGLPAAASWTVVQTSAGTQLKCSIAASAGDRIRVCGNVMYIGARYFDWVLLLSDGSIDEYATSEGATPPSEGNPTMYPSRTYGSLNNPEMFTVGSGHIAAGLVTIALAHQGAGTGPGNIVYAHPTYPFRLRLENIGPEPA